MVGEGRPEWSEAQNRRRHMAQVSGPEGPVLSVRSSFLCRSHSTLLGQCRPLSRSPPLLLALPVYEAHDVRHFPWIVCDETEYRDFVCYVMARPLPSSWMSDDMNSYQVRLQTAEVAFC